MTTTHAPTKARRTRSKPESPPRQDLTLIESCARRICAVDDKTVENIIEKGVTFAEVKELLKGEVGAYGKALALAGYRGTKIPEMYIYIANDPVLTDAKTFSHLPPEYTKLHKLAQQPDTVKRRLIAERKLRRDMTLTEIGALVADVRAVETNVPEVADDEVVAKVGLNAGPLGDLLNNTCSSLLPTRIGGRPSARCASRFPTTGGLYCSPRTATPCFVRNGKSLRHRPAPAHCLAPLFARSGRSFSNVIAKTTAS